MVTSRLFHAPPPRGMRLLTRTLALAVSVLAVTGASSALAATTGPYKSKWQEYSDFKNHVVYRPATLPAGQKLPVLLWGESGCISNGLIMNGFLSEVASHGIVVLATGGATTIGATSATMLEAGIDWAKKQDTLAGGPFQGRLNTSKIVVSGHSCGGLEALTVGSRRSEIAGTALMNSGQLSVNQAQLNQQKAPILYVLGGSGDVAYSNGLRDYDKLPASLPAFLASDGNGHFGTYFGSNGGTYAQILKDWVKYRASGDATAGARFTGLVTAPIWAGFQLVKKRNL